MSRRVIPCDDCDGTGHVWRHYNLPDDPYYMHETNESCPACEGEGYIEVEDEPITLDDLEEEHGL